jgi:hypothetical protein
VCVCVCVLHSAAVETNITTCVSNRVSKNIAMWRPVKVPNPRDYFRKKTAIMQTL